jgi:hypothetical protein
MLSTISIVIIVLGILATLLFVAGFFRGLSNAIALHRHPPTSEPEVSENEHWPSVIFAIVASAVIIAAVGFTPAAIYAGPILVLVTAAGVGLAFFLEGKAGTSAR